MGWRGTRSGLPPTIVLSAWQVMSQVTTAWVDTWGLWHGSQPAPLLLRGRAELVQGMRRLGSQGTSNSVVGGGKGRC